MIDALFDTETTGLPGPHLLPLDKQPHIIEFYSCLVSRETGEIIDELDQLFSVPVAITPEITRITGITEADLKGQPTIAEFCPKIVDFFGRANRVVAHNLAFDIQMVEIEMQRYGYEVAWPEKLCTVEMTEHLDGFRLSLTALHEKLFGEIFKGSHRAREDVNAMKRCYLELIKRGEI